MERCRSGSVQSLSVDAWMFIRHAGSVFMSRFCILSGKKGRFIIEKRPRFVDGHLGLNKCKQPIINHISKSASKKHDRCMMVE